MSPLLTIALFLLMLGAILLGPPIVRYNRVRREVLRYAAAASSAQLEAIYALVEQTGTVASNGFVLARTYRKAEHERCLVPLPEGLPDFPWSGRVIEVVATDEVVVRFVDEPATEPVLLGEAYRPVRVPRHATRKPARHRNVYSPGEYVAASAPLREALAAACPNHPLKLLSHLLCAAGGEGVEFEPIDQARIGTSPSWVQDPEYQHCDDCRKRMRLILQVPGPLISRKAFRRGTFYFFGCPAHPDRTRTLGQYT